MTRKPKMIFSSSLSVKRKIVKTGKLNLQDYLRFSKSQLWVFGSTEKKGYSLKKVEKGWQGFI
jgi:hypothetical protein